MAMQTGSATDYHDALDKLRIFLAAQGWTVLRWNPPASISTPGELAVRPIGTGSFRPTLTFRSIADVTNGFYHWIVSGAQDFDAGAAQLAQPGSSNGFFTPISNNTITYWFYANDRRVICIFKVGTNYSSLYAGLFLPYALPNEYRRPLYISGNHRAQSAITLANSSNSFIADPGQSAAQYMTMADLWVICSNRTDSTLPDPNLVSSTASAFLWPKKTEWHSGSSQSSTSASWSHWNNEGMRPNLAGEMPLYQCQIVAPNENGGKGALMGALDGVYDAPGFNRIAEQTVTFGGSTFRLFPNMYRSNNPSFMAIEEV